MSEVQIYGDLNSHAIAIIMKELMQRALRAIVAQRNSFVAEAKVGKTGKMDDVLTSADLAAQEVIVRSLMECFPTFGIVAEEDGLRKPSTHPKFDIFFTIDPLDGTKAFVRKQAHGVGSMISLVVNGEVIAAYVADVNTWDLYGFRPDSTQVHRHRGLDHHELLTFDASVPMSEKYALLRDPLHEYSPLMQRFIGQSGIVKSHNNDGGSIGIGFARLWIGEVGIMVLKPGLQTPWDLAPILGISNRLGFRFYRVDPESGVLMEFRPLISDKILKTEEEIIVFHESQIGVVQPALRKSL